LDALGALGINLGLLIANVVNVLLMILLLSAVAYRPIVRMLRTRRERIAEGLNNARRAEEALASAEADKQAVLDQARAEAQRIAAESRARADEAADQIRAEARTEAARIIKQAEDDAAAEKQRLLADMRGQIVDLSIAAANRLIGASLDEKRQKAIVSDFFTAVPAEAKKLGGSVIVVTALPLTAAEQKKFKAELAAESVEFVVDPAILGGVVVRGGGREVNASFASQLDELRASLR
jgi:F-type H+-transporting ATPase subunit b